MRSKGFSAETEIARTGRRAPALHDTGILAFHRQLPARSAALGAGRRSVDYLNDIHGFPDPALYPELARATAKLIVMHRVGSGGKAVRENVPPSEILDRIFAFFEKRLAALLEAGIARERLILDPGMGLFLSTDPEASLTVLENLPRLAEAFGLPLLVSVSRKSFLKALGRPDMAEASLAAEMFAAAQGATYIRTHAPAALREGLAVLEAMGEEGWKGRESPAGLWQCRCSGSRFVTRSW